MNHARISEIDRYEVMPDPLPGFSDPFGKGWERERPIILKEYTPDGLKESEVRRRTPRTRHFSEQLVRL